MIPQRTFTTFPVNNIALCKQQLLNWLNRFSSCCFLDNHNYDLPGHVLECVAGAGSLATLETSAENAFASLRDFHARHEDWIFGYLGYELGYALEGLSIDLPDPMGFPDLTFFVPEYVFLLSGETLRIGTRGGDAETIWKEICATPVPTTVVAGEPPLLRARFSEREYLDTVAHLQRHIARGDCYEITFCQEFFVENIAPDPLSVYRRLADLSPNPSSAYYALDGRYLLCASPERYLQHRGGRLLSQPIKGTARRWPDDPDRDLQQRETLFNSPKERSENVMIVDLVRNDLSRVCAEGSVRVDELWGIYAFPQVFQMISSVSGILAGGLDWVQALKATFPMGSMTGAPKRRAMELIGAYEKTKRGLYSGAVGYVEPGGDFDFNVVIRSILYNASRRYLSFPAGSAITAAADPLQEYAECLLKADAMKKALGAGPNAF